MSLKGLFETNFSRRGNVNAAWRIVLPILTLFLMPIQSAQAGLVLNFAKQVTVTNSNEKDAPPKVTVSTIQVELGTDYFRNTENDTDRVYNFKSRRILTIDTKKKTYHDDSLFIDLGFRGREFQNRQHLGKALASASVDNKLMSTTLNEHNLSLKAKNHEPEIQKGSNDKAVTYHWEDKALFEYSKKLHKVNKTYQDGLTRFLRYHISGHPNILEDIQELSGIPEKITVTTHNVEKRSVTLRLLSSKQIPDMLPTLEGYSKSKDAGELSALLTKDINYTKEDLKIVATSLLVKAKKAYEEKRQLDAMLAYLEYTLVTGEKMPSQFFPQRELIAADADVKTLVSSLSPKTKEEAKKSIDTLVSLREKSTDRKHVLKIFEANNRLILGKAQESKALFHAVLGVNPYITGAWKDLGDIYFRSYNSQAAWRCWDTARALNGSHHLLVRIKQFEERLIKINPEFF